VIADMNTMLVKVVEEGTGKRAILPGVKVGGKTGTTNAYRDAWFIGFDARTTCGVWVGFDQPRQIVDRGYGATLALPIWVKIMNAQRAEGG
jgi:penicillin-binding protein 1A